MFKKYLGNSEIHLDVPSSWWWVPFGFWYNNLFWEVYILIKYQNYTHYISFLSRDVFTNLNILYASLL